jgi:hypothetical protein
MRNRLWQAVLGVTAVLGLALAPTAAVSAAPATATATCSQLQAKLTRLWNLYNHVVDEEAKARLMDQIDEVQSQMEAQGCFTGTKRTLTADVQIWTDSSLAPGPYKKNNMAFDVTIMPAGDVKWVLPTTTFNSGITITQRAGQSASGTYSDSGYLSLTAPIAVDTPYGSATGTLNVSTDQTVSTGEGPKSGARVSSPADKRGSVTLVGTTPLTIGVTSLNVQIQVSGTLS